jgi:putative Ca2+/H+ antiporter (TMEM165/GDT1 family)
MVKFFKAPQFKILNFNLVKYFLFSLILIHSIVINQEIVTTKFLDDNFIEKLDSKTITENMPISNSPDKTKKIESPTPETISTETFIETAFSGFSVIILAEIGDKTFFLVMIFSTTNSFLTTILTASSVMLLWNFICLMIGSSIPVLFYKGFFDIVGMLVFLIFGLTMIYTAYHMDHHPLHKSLNETKSELSRKSLTRKSFKTSTTDDNEKLREPLIKPDVESSEPHENETDEYEDEAFHSKWAFTSSLAIAEFGDKTQISSIIMGSTQNFYAVLLGTSLARIGGIILAIIFGKIIARNVTTKQVTYLGGFIFIIFSLIYSYKLFIF